MLVKGLGTRLCFVCNKYHVGQKNPNTIFTSLFFSSGEDKIEDILAIKVCQMCILLYHKCLQLQPSKLIYRINRNGLLTLGAHAQRGLLYLVCVSVCLSVCVCVCVCLSPLILALQAPNRLMSDTNGSSATSARKIMWCFR